MHIINVNGRELMFKRSKDGIWAAEVKDGSMTSEFVKWRIPRNGKQGFGYLAELLRVEAELKGGERK